MLKESEEAEAEHTCVHYNTETSHDNDFFKKLQFELGDVSAKKCSIERCSARSVAVLAR